MKWIPVLAVSVILAALYTSCTRQDTEQPGTGSSSGTMDRSTTPSQPHDTTKTTPEVHPAPESGTSGSSSGTNSPGTGTSTGTGRPGGTPPQDTTNPYPGGPSGN